MYFKNTILPGAKAVEVIEAIKRWHRSKGFEPVTERLLFDCRYTDDERRLFVLANAQGCVVLDSQDGPGRCSAFGQFPAVLQLWADGGSWGFRLEHHGANVFTHCAKRGWRRPDLREVETLAADFGVANRRKLRRAAAGSLLGTAKACGEFAAALNAPVAALNFYDVDVANAGITEERLIAGWRCQLLCFTRAQPDPSVEARSGADVPMEFTDEDRALMARMQKRMKWLGWLVAPISLVFRLLLIPVMAALVATGLVGSIPWVCRFCPGKAVVIRDRFVAELKHSQPLRIAMAGNVVTNTRHRCSVTVNPPARAHSDLLPRKGGHDDEPVFDLELGEVGIHCSAYRTDQVPKWGGVKVLEKRASESNGMEVQFEKRRTTATKRRWFQYEWTIRAKQAVYRFICSPERELTAEQLETIEQIVRSFNTA